MKHRKQIEPQRIKFVTRGQERYDIAVILVSWEEKDSYRVIPTRHYCFKSQLYCEFPHNVTAARQKFFPLERDNDEKYYV